ASMSSRKRSESFINLMDRRQKGLASEQSIYASSNNDAAFEGLIDSLVDARGKCAHLKKYKYGYLPGDQRLKELQFLEPQLRELCRALIKFA
ncbi:hypothetical protein, partial [Thiobaca trueperi]|uniref:hypothetical protein n=1 Tax=Thiobaca trueperi TaxID=127458 RepID=UPI001A9D34A6